MDDKNVAGQAVGRARPRRPRPDSIIGRLTYTPAQEDDCLGQLRRNHARDEAPRFKQVTPFTPWCEPTRTTSSQSSKLRPSHALRSQAYWLLEYFPEASIDDDDIESLVLEEITSSQAKKQPLPIDATCLFSIGEISDLRETDAAVRVHPTLAVASGVAGNVLRLISLGREDWVWTEADIRVRLHIPNPRIEGEWCQDGVPISLIKFAIDARKYDPIRWLLVQNGTSTTVYEPELRPIPMPSGGTSLPASGRTAVSQIYANPLLTINCDRTGGSLQSDVCFSRYHGEDTPQLVIIDQRGSWSVWDITGSRTARPKHLTPVMRLCGNTISGTIPKLPSSSATEPQQHRVLCLSSRQKDTRRSSHLGNTRSASEHSDDSSEGESQLQRPQRRLLLLCKPRALHLFDLSTGRLHSVSHLALSDDRHRILGLAPSRLDPSQAFVLTSTSLLWVAAREGRNDTVSLEILVSCSHQKDVNDPTLRLDVSPGAYLNDHMACFVCVRSARDTEMTTFWFINPGPGTPVRYHRDLISLRSPSNFVGLSMLPAGRRMGDEPTSAAGQAMRNAKLRFFQLVILGHDLDVHSALCVWTDGPGVSVPPPDSRVSLEERRNRRLKLLRNLTRAFVVPDEFDERLVFGKKGFGTPSMEMMLKGGIERRIDFRLAAQRLSATEEPAAARVERSMSPADDPFGFLGKAIERETRDGYMPRCSLLDLAKRYGAGRDLFRLAREWDAQQGKLHLRTGEWLFVPEARRPLTDFGPDDLVERLHEMFPEPLPSGDTALHHSRENVLQNMAAEMFLSNIGVSAVPQSWAALPDTESGLSSSLPFRSSPPLLSSQSGLAGSSKATSSGKVREEEQEHGDPVALRLRKYATINTSATSRGEPTLGLSRWELGADPGDITWKPGQDLDAEDAINRRRKKIEARRRKAERLSLMILGEGSAEQSQAQAATQPLPTIVPTSSQQQPWEFSSQQLVQSPRVPGSPLRREYLRDSLSLAQSQAQWQSQSQGTPSQPRSQVLPGVFGGRPSPFKRSPLKKGKRKSELRLSGFR
ncbi:hypothetical protein VTK56DRAFT_7460 [Thermocarpiscus australiensis]